MNNETTNLTSETVATMLPNVGLNGEPLVGKGVDNNYKKIIDNEIEQVDEDVDLVKENMEDKIINFSTKEDVNYKTRKLIVGIYTLQLKIEEMELNSNDNDSKKLIEMKRELVRRKKELLTIKKSASSELKKAISDLEKVGTKEVEKKIDDIKKDRDKVEEITEGISMTDVAGYYITEMNSIKSVIDDNIAERRANKKNAIEVRKSEVINNIPDSEDYIKTYNQKLEDANVILTNIYKTFANKPMSSSGKKFSDYVKINATGEKSPKFIKSGNKYIYIGSTVCHLTFDASEHKDENVSFTYILHIMRKITRDATRQNKDKSVVFRCDIGAKGNPRLKKITVGGYLRTTLGTLKVSKTVKESTDDLYTEVYNAHKGKGAYLRRTKEKYEALEKYLSKIKNEDIDAEKRIDLAEEASDIISSLITDAQKIPNDDFFDSIADINFIINGFKKVWTAIKARFSITGVATYRPRTKRSEVINSLRKIQKELDSAIIKAGREIKKREKAESSDRDRLSPELKRLDEKRGRLADLKRELEEAKKKEKSTGEKRYEYKVDGLTRKIEKLQKEVDDDEAKIEEEMEKIKKHRDQDVKESVITEAADMEPEIRPIVEELNRKGYKVRYASPGHKKLRKKEDFEPDGVYYNKLYSDARIMFDSKYNFPEAPKYWHWRDVDGCSYLDITPKGFNVEKGDTPNDAFDKWKDAYMNSLKTYVNNLKPNNSSKETKESVNEFTESLMDTIYGNMGMDDIMYTESNIKFNSENILLKELDELLS